MPQPENGTIAYSSYGLDPQTGWFTETDATWPGQRFSLALEGFSCERSVLHASQSDFQSILVFQSAQYGHVLVLDGVVQLSEHDEFAYHEMMTHLALCSMKKASQILIVGGGDGGVLQQLLRHYSDEIISITLVEIDPAVIQVACEFFPGVATAFADPRVTVVHADAAKFLQTTTDQTYEVILLDSSDPVGPAASLFAPEFYESMYDALVQENGIVCAQAECLWIHGDLIADVLACCRDMFTSADYASTLVPTYPCGQMGFVVARKGGHGSCRVPVRKVPQAQEALRYYSVAMHEAAFVLPRFVEEQLGNHHGGKEPTECCFPHCAIQ